LVIGLLRVTLVAGSLQTIGQKSVPLVGRQCSCGGLSGLLLTLLGVADEVVVLTSVSRVVSVGRLQLRHAPTVIRPRQRVVVPSCRHHRSDSPGSVRLKPGRVCPGWPPLLACA
jgi:hypothetical protein